MKAMSLFRIILILVFSLGFRVSQAQQWVMDEKASKVSFVIKNAGLSVDGSFSGFTASITFDPLHSDQALISATVPVATINTGVQSRDTHLKKEEYFNAAKYAHMTFQSKSIVNKGNGKYEMTGDLTIKGVTKSVKIPFTFEQSSNTAIFKGSTMINRRDFGVGGSSWILSDDLTIQLHIKAIKK